MEIVTEVLEQLGSEMDTVMDSLSSSLGRLRTGRANASLLDGIRVDYYGTPTLLTQCAQISVPEPRLIMVKPWEKTILQAIERAMREVGVGSGGTRNISGTNSYHVLLEQEISNIHKKDSALLFASGYIANQSAISVLGSKLKNCIIFSERF